MHQCNPALFIHYTLTKENFVFFLDSFKLRQVFKSFLVNICFFNLTERSFFAVYYSVIYKIPDKNMHVEDLLIKFTSNMQGQVLEVANIDSLLSSVQCTTTDDLTS